MDEAQMIGAIKRDVDVTCVTGGVYVFNFGGKHGSIRKCPYDEVHYGIMFDNLTPEQVVEVFGTKPEVSE
jgi:hypothetical protein